MFHPKFIHKTNVHTHTISIQHWTGARPCHNKLRGKMRLDCKSKLSVFADVMIVYMRNSKKFAKLLKLVCECSIVER